MATEVTVIVDPDGGAGYDYTSLAAAIAGEARDLVTADEQLTIKCRCTGGTADGAVTVDGFTTDATRYVKIWTDPTESYRHAGAYPSGNKYRIEVTNEAAVVVLDPFTRVVGISAKATGTGSDYFRGITVNAISVRVDKCYFKSRKTAGYGYGYGFFSSVTIVGSIYISNTVFWGDSSIAKYGRGVMVDGSSKSIYLYNCTIAGGWQYGIIRGNSSIYAYNCAVFNNSDDFYGTITIDHCASDDGDGTNPVDISPGATEADDWAACFTDYANGDFSLKSDSVCVGAGTDDPGSGLYSDDILGNTRTSAWDIGAFEYVPFKAAWAINSNRVIQ